MPAQLRLPGLLLLLLNLLRAHRSPTIYPAYNSVADHPDVRGGRYATPHIDFRSFGNRSRFATRGNFCDARQYAALLDMFGAAGLQSAGDLTAPNWGMLDCKLDDFVAAMTEVKQRGLRVSGFWGSFPGAGPAQGIDGEPWLAKYGDKFAALDRIFGAENWTGVNVGEQDGHYESNYGHQMMHTSTDRREQLGNFLDEFEGVQLQLGSKVTSLMSDMTGSHYWASSGLFTVIGAEVAQGLPSSQVSYSFLRGAAKQYGTLLIGNPSTCGRFGDKCYNGSSSPTGGFTHDARKCNGSSQIMQPNFCGPQCGPSLSLLRRLIYQHISYNSAVLLFESFGGVNPNGVDATMDGVVTTNLSQLRLTPIAKLQAGIRTAMRGIESSSSSPTSFGSIGVHQAPIAFLLDFMAGFLPPRRLYDGQPAPDVRDTKLWQPYWQGQLYRTAFAALVPYGPGDYLTNNLFKLAFTNYEDSSYFWNEDGFLSATPYGDAVDTLLSDAPGWLLRRYGTIVIAGEIQSQTGLSAELADKLQVYMEEAGGHVVITAGSLARLSIATATVFGGIGVGRCELLPAGSNVSLSTGATVREQHTFELCQLSLAEIEAANVTKLAWSGPLIASVRIAVGTAGRLTVLASPFGVSSESVLQPGASCTSESAPSCPDPSPGGKPSNETIWSVANEHLPNPFPLLSHATALIDAALKQELLFEAGNGLACAVNRVAAGEWTVTVTNPSVTQRPLQLVSHVGTISSVVELKLDQQSFDEPSYVPFAVPLGSLGKSTKDSIAGNDVRMFAVKTTLVAPSGLKTASAAPPPARVTDRALSLPRRCDSVREALRDRPSFFQNFDSVIVDYTYIEQREVMALQNEAEWIVSKQKLRIVVDLSNGMQILPSTKFRLVNNSAREYGESMRRIAAIVRKMPALGSKDLVLSLHVTPEITANASAASDSFADSLRFIASVATPLNITVHLRHNLKMPIGQGSEASLDHFNAPPAGNMVMNRASLSSVYEWLERYELRPSIHVAVGAPLLVFQGMLARDVLPELGNASMIMMASPGVDQGGLWSEHGLLANANDAEQAIMRGLLAALRPGALVVLDATFPDRDAEYEDVRALRRLMDMKSGEGV
jgi:hypothetical protein